MHFIPLAPSPVKDIDISTKTNSLLISWSRGSGNVEQYRLMLTDKNIVVHDNIVDKHDTSYTFRGLIPGHLYNFTIVTIAAGLQNYRWKLVRTGKLLLFYQTEKQNSNKFESNLLNYWNTHKTN